MKKNILNPKIVILDSVFPDHDIERKILIDAGCNVVTANPECDAEIRRLTFDADGVIVNMHPLSAETILNMEHCAVISRYGTGFDNVDVQAADDRKIWVANVPDYCIEETSDHAIALILSCTRNIALKDRLVRAGNWKLEQKIESTRIAGKTLGIIGFGKIGQAVCRKMSGWNLSRILVSDPWQDERVISECGASAVSLEELCMKSDIITLHVPLTDQSKYLVSRKEISVMKHNAIIVNTSRGKIIDETALVTALKNNRIAGAGIDVFEQEPLPADCGLKALDNTVLTDHTAYHSGESVIELKTLAALNVVETFKEGKPLYPVNRIAQNVVQEKLALSSSSIY
ncbi:MAG: C-terminal binding protein [Spirochaetales bacterium]|nr:C-terminal binding protein [Spirochaetales bacterium]